MIKSVWLRIIFLAFLLFLTCRSRQTLPKNPYCPYHLGDYLEYHNKWSMKSPDGTKEESEVFIIYEIVGMDNITEGTVVQLKRYYTDVNGTSEALIVNVYTQDRVLMIRPDGSRDSLALKLGETSIGTIKDETDSTGIREVIKIVDNNVTLRNEKGIVFDSCLQVVTTQFSSDAETPELLYQKTSYYKDTILVRYTSIDRRRSDDKRDKELKVVSELKTYNIYLWE